ncbi:MAG: hypothetical protein RJB65_161 [Actinomycetota bacterium]
MKKFIAAAAAALAITTLGAGSASAEGDQTIAEIATTTEGFSTLVAALGAADLVGPFDSCDDAPTTVFAPTDEAFAAALEALGMTAEQLLADTELLTSVLTYHVVAGSVDAATVVGLSEATTLNGAPIMIEVVDGGVVLNGSVNVVATDIMACNGIIHVIDAVLLPPAETGEMPATGSSSNSLLLLGGSLLLAGLGTTVALRRRTVTA